MEQGRKLRALYRSLGWSRADCGKFLHVTERCLRNWECGRHPVPYAAFRLMRITCYMELPGKDWHGWHLGASKLWTPEGHALNPHDAKWWSLLCRRAECGSKALRELAVLKAQAGHPSTSMPAAHPAPGTPFTGDTGRGARQVETPENPFDSMGKQDGCVLVTQHMRLTDELSTLPSFSDKFNPYQQVTVKFGGKNHV